MNKPVYCNDHMSITPYDSITSASKDTGVSCDKILQCCEGKRKSAGGYYWCFQATITIE